MKKFFAKIFSVMLAVTTLISTIPIISNAVEQEYAGLLYEASNGSITITGYSSYQNPFLDIPGEIDGLPVTKITSYAFQDYIGLSELSIPASVTEIGEYGVDTVFTNCFNLSKITVDENNRNFFSIDGVLYHYESPGSYSLVHYPLAKEENTFTFPENVEGIYMYAFKETVSQDQFYFEPTYHLENIILPESMKWIGYSAFEDCISLKSITIYPGIANSEIAYNAFYNCNSLTDVYFKASEEKWNSIIIGSGNECLLNATMHFLSEHTHTLKHVVNIYCTADGEEYDICTQCNKIFNKVTIKPKGHNLKHTYVEPTCTADGEEYDTCQLCNSKFNYTIIKATGHNFGEWKVVKEPTTSENGLEKRTCLNCSEAETRSTDKLNVVSDNETGVEIIFNKEFDKETEIVVSQSFDDGTFKLISDSYGNARVKAFDITPYKNSEKVQPNGKITVRIPLPEGFDPDNTFVSYVNSENGTAEVISSSISNGYIEFETDHFSVYAVVQRTPSVKIVKLEDTELKYKSSAKLSVGIYADEGAKYTLKYSSSNPQVISVDENGNVRALARGSAEITCTVTDSYGNTVSDTCTVKSSYTFGQWLIKILLFGWIWY